MAKGSKHRVILGVTGGIAAYKSPDVVRRLREQGAEVQVVMTDAASRFVTPVTFQAVSGNPVRDDLWDPQAEASMGHIELARWAGAILVAPASADFIARLAAGMANDLLTTVCLATEARLIVAPAMNRLMWDHPATQTNVTLLRERGVSFVGPAEGEQACGEVGPGRMLEPGELANEILASFSREGTLSGVTVMVTAGPTREAIDPVRYITNRSSGKMGYAVARAAAEAGARVLLVSGPVNLAAPPGVERYDVETADQMYRTVHDYLADVDIFIGAAAVSDYRPGSVAAEKIKKSSDSMDLKLQKCPDILASVAASDGRPFAVGFAAETEKLEEHALKKLHRKKLDLIAANRVGDNLGFDCDHNALTVLWNGGKQQLAEGPKMELARELVGVIVQRYRASPGSAIRAV